MNYTPKYRDNQKIRKDNQDKEHDDDDDDMDETEKNIKKEWHQ